MNQQQFIDEFQALSAEFPLRNSAFFVALSGGMDSCVLLDLMANLVRQQPELRVVVMHFDHCLQADSTQWAAFCSDRCEYYGLDFVSSDTGVTIDKRIGLEASARKARYQWFDQVIQQAFATDTELQHAIVLTAHHCDDQAETLLLNMLRGTGLKGLRGIAEKKQTVLPDDKTRTVLRPLLSFSQAELQQYAEQQKLPWCDDPSNQDTQYRRNAIRHHLLPELRKIRSDAVQQLHKLSRRAADAEALLKELAVSDLALTQHYDRHFTDESYGLALAGLRAFSVSRQLNGIRCWLDLIQYPAESEMDLLQVLDWSLNGTNSGAELRRGGRCYRYYQDVLYVMPVQLEDAEALIDQSKPWPDSSQPMMLFTSASDESWQLCCHSDSPYYGQALLLRASHDIHDIQLPGGEGHIRAKQCFQSEKVPPWRRQRAIFVASEDKRFIGIVGGQESAHFFVQAISSD